MGERAAPPTIPWIEEWDRLGFALVQSFGGGLLLLHVVHAFAEGEDVRTFVYGIAIPMALSVGIMVAGEWVRRNETSVSLLRVAQWSWLIAVLMALAVCLLILYQRAEGVQMSDLPFVVVNTATVGATIGFGVGVYDSRHRRAKKRSRAAQERAEVLNDRLTVLNRVLRHDIRNKANVIRGTADLLTSQQRDVADRAATIREQSDALVEIGEQARTVEQLLTDPGAGEDREVVDLTRAAEAAVEQVREANSEAEIVTSLPERQPVYAHPMTTVALRNVLRRAVEEGGTARVRSVRIESATGGAELEIESEDLEITDGEATALERGSETQLEHATGLELWLGKWIVAAADGEFALDDGPERTAVKLRFETADGTSAPA